MDNLSSLVSFSVPCFYGLLMVVFTSYWIMRLLKAQVCKFDHTTPDQSEVTSSERATHQLELPCITLKESKKGILLSWMN